MVQGISSEPGIISSPDITASPEATPISRQKRVLFILTFQKIIGHIGI